MAKTEKRSLGDVGESIAAQYLQHKGYLVVERNYLRPWGEIDIVAKIGKKWVFVEVKTVSRENLGGISRGTFRPEDNVHAAKLRRLHRAIETYCMSKKVERDSEYQVDVMCVYLDTASKKARVDHIENVIL
jgi:putative endonuclease